MSSAIMTQLSPTAAAASVGDLNPLLLDAKNIYVNQLSEAMGPYVLKTIESVYAETTQAGSSKVLIRFQQRLKEIPVWNSSVVEQHAANIEARFPYLGDLIAAAFVAYVKVMSSIKLRADKPNIRLKLPTNTAFVHKAFVNVARDFYAAPQMAANPALYGGMRVAIERTIRDMLPIKDILKAYLGNTVDDAHTVSPTLDAEDEEDDHEDDHESHGDHADHQAQPSPAMFDTLASPEQPMQQMQQPMQPMQQMQQPMQPMQQPMQPMNPVAQVTECETKTISIPPVKDDDLFSDADDDETDWKR